MILSYLVYFSCNSTVFHQHYFFFFYLLSSDEVLGDESRTLHPPTLFSHAFGIANLVL